MSQCSWIRAIVDLLIHQANGSSYDNALHYAKQAAACMERGGKVNLQYFKDRQSKTRHLRNEAVIDLPEG